ncbi:hypothetical protein B296_00013292 [Ensete ventricosum]|uniref:Uncharacterized protein n=1 Tax=Ensete ventricosum TaxID=4639 RepID=A0A427B5T5_ENSVE|nr:hypothetical protein B296_00013292 [Ensete ventricosum]
MSRRSTPTTPFRARSRNARPKKPSRSTDQTRIRSEEIERIGRSLRRIDRLEGGEERGERRGEERRSDPRKGNGLQGEGLLRKRPRSQVEGARVLR